MNKKKQITSRAKANLKLSLFHITACLSSVMFFLFFLGCPVFNGEQIAVEQHVFYILGESDK